MRHIYDETAFEASKLERASMIRKVGMEETSRFESLQERAVELVAEILETEIIDAEKTGKN